MHYKIQEHMDFFLLILHIYLTYFDTVKFLNICISVDFEMQNIIIAINHIIYDNKERQNQ